MKITSRQVQAIEKKLEKFRNEEHELRGKLQLAYNKLFAASEELKDAIARVESGERYELDRNGEIVSVAKLHNFSDFSECLPQLEVWLNDRAIGCNWESDSLTLCQGEEIIIQDDTRNDNGVWLNGKCIISEEAYRDENGQVDEEKRNEMIEHYMEATGYFPGVFRVTQYGDVFPVSTQKKK